MKKNNEPLEEGDKGLHWYTWPDTNFSNIKTDFPSIQPNDVAQILHTSGTTGGSKGVVLTHKQIYSAALNVINFASITQEDRELTTLPLVRMFGQLHVYSYTIAGGALVIMPNALDLSGVLRQLVERKITSFPQVPTVFLKLMKNY